MSVEVEVQWHEETVNIFVSSDARKPVGREGVRE